MDEMIDHWLKFMNKLNNILFLLKKQLFQLKVLIQTL